jgi:hypothetical protein
MQNIKCKKIQRIYVCTTYVCMSEYGRLYIVQRSDVCTTDGHRYNVLTLNIKEENGKLQGKNCIVSCCHHLVLKNEKFPLRKIM